MASAQPKREIDEKTIEEIKQTFSSVFIIWDSLAQYYYYLGDTEQCEQCLVIAEGVKSEHTQADIRYIEAKTDRTDGEDIHTVTEP